MTRDAFGAVGPLDEFLLHVDNAQTRWKALHKGAAYLGIFKKAQVSGSVRTCHQFCRQDAGASSVWEGLIKIFLRNLEESCPQ